MYVWHKPYSYSKIHQFVLQMIDLLLLLFSIHVLVMDKHNFQNNNLLYRFRYDDGTYRVKQESRYLIAGGLRVYLRLAGQHNTLLK